jgi:hypothetical protein
MPPDNLATMSLSPDQELVRCSPIEGSGQLKSRKQMVSSVNGWIPTNFEVWRQMVRRLPNCQNGEIAARLRDRPKPRVVTCPALVPDLDLAKRPTGVGNRIPVLSVPAVRWERH